MLNWLKRVFHRHQWEAITGPIDYSSQASIKLGILPTERCSKCGLVRKYFGPRRGWMYKSDYIGFRNN